MNDTYTMTISLNVLKHLGIGLYSNIPDILSGAIANAWDADAKRVSICVDAEKETITIEDDGCGMNVSDVNNKYLKVGYERRKEGSKTPLLSRAVMGRKGIGKLSLFSIANIVDIWSIKDGELHGFRMDAHEIRRMVESDNSIYHPEQLDCDGIKLAAGTRIVLSGMKREATKLKALKKRLARRFSILGENYEFAVTLNGEPVALEDRDYHNRLQYAWIFGDLGRMALAKSSAQAHDRDPSIDINGDAEKIDGWIGTTKNSGQTKDDITGENINKITIMVRGKMAQEDILEEFAEGGVYSKYIIGEIHADFLDTDDKEDISTTSRQKIIEDDPRYGALKEKIRTELKRIQSEWTELRNQSGKKEAFEIPGVKEWYEQLSQDHRIAAKKLFGKINQIAIDDSSEKRQVFISNILAFETLKFRSMLNRLEDIDPENLAGLKDIFSQIEDLESVAYYQIIKGRLETIEKICKMTSENAKEAAIRNHLFEHLWLIDPLWERAPHSARMEETVKKIMSLKKYALPKEQLASRLDIKYTTFGGKHMIIELKRPERTLSFDELFAQIRKYHAIILEALRQHSKENEVVEIKCIIGYSLASWNDPKLKNSDIDSLKAQNASIITYDELIERAQKMYQEYTEQKESVGRVYKLIMAIEHDDAKAISQNGE